jgi:hypothetical protein
MGHFICFRKGKPGKKVIVDVVFPYSAWNIMVRIGTLQDFWDG